MANVELATAYVSLVPTMQGVQGKVAEALAPAGAEADKAGKASGGMFAGGFSGALGAAAIGAAATGAAVAGAAVGLYKVGAVFDDVTDTIRVGTGASGAALDSLVAVAKNVGTSVPTSFATAGETVTALNKRLGLSGDTLSKVSQQYIQAGNILGETVDINTTSAAFSAFGIEGGKVEGAMDTLFRVSQATGVGMNELAAQVQTSAAPLKNLGFGFEQTAALAGTLDKAGLNTSAVMASMGKGLVTLAKAGEEPQAAFKRVTGELGAFVKSGDTAGALNLASKVFGTKGASQFVGALQSGKINLDDLTKSAGLSGDTILGLGKETADAAESWQLIKNKALAALEPMGTAVFNLAGQGLGFLADNMDGIIEKVSALGQGVASKVGPVFASLSSTLGPVFSQLFSTLGPVIASLIPQLLQVFSAFSPLQLIFKAIQPVLPQIVGLIGTLAASLGGALTGALTTLMPTFMELANMLSTTLAGVFVAVMPAVLQIVGMLAQLFTQLAPVIAQIVGVVGQLVTQLVAALMPIILQLVSTVMPMVVTIFGAVISAIVPLVTMLAGLLIPIIQALMPVVITVFGMIANVIGSVMQIIMGVIQVVTGIISGNWSQVWEGIGNIFGGIWNTIVSVVGGAIGIVGSVISSGLGVAFGFVSNVLGNIGRFFADTWSNITSGISGFIDGFLGFFRDLPGKIIGFLSGAGTWLLDMGKNIIDGLVKGIQGMAGTVAKAILNLVPEAIRGPIEQALGIHSPSRVAMWWMEMIGAGFVKQAPVESRRMQAAMDGLITVPSAPAYGAASAAGDFRTAGGFGSTFNIYETDDPIATAHAVTRRQTALAT